MSATITFCGGVGTVTGANFLFDTGEKKILIDCGTRERENDGVRQVQQAFPYDPAGMDALVVTHAHQDHIGRIPELVRAGFRGAIFSTPPTKELSALMFDDAIEIMERAQKEKGEEPTYSRADADRAVSLWKTYGYHEPFEIGDASVELLDAGHILGSAMVRFMRGSKAVIFTGDLGNSPEPLLNDTESPSGANYIVMESVYGDRVHEARDDRYAILKSAVESAREHSGTLLIPSFSLERTQVLLYELNTMIEKGEIAPITVYLDAPLAIRATAIFEKHRDYFNADVQRHYASGDDPFSFNGLKLTPHVAESKAIHDSPDPKVIIAGAGMSGGGRVRAHEKRYLGDNRNTVLFVGYQAPGTLGRRIQDGEKKIMIDYDHIHVRANIMTVTGYSGHKDRDGLIAFAESARESAEEIFVVMGEPQASIFLAQRIRDFAGINARVPHAGELAELAW